MAGGDLEARLAHSEERRLPIDESLRIADQLTQALEHAHVRAVIHRDIKPGNVWFSEDGAAHLGDFGLAVLVDRTRLTREGMMVGTASYMAPEQALGRSPDVRSDLYGLGTVIYEMLTGRPPFVGDDAVSVISQHIHTPPVAPSWHCPQVPKPLEALVLSLLAKDPDARPASASEVRQALGTIEAVPTAPAAGDSAEAVIPLERLSSGVFVGRERELEQARACLDEGFAGRGQVLMMVGEPGIGKTRTAEELTTWGRMRGAQVLWGRCYEGEGAPAYWPWVQIVRAYIHEHDPQLLRSEMGSGAAIIAEIVSGVRELLPGLETLPPTDPEHARFRLFDSIASFLVNASRRVPLLLVIDDLHWADRSSLLLLQFLVQEIPEARIAVVGTYRDVELSRQHPLEEALAEISRGRLHTRILLRGLSEEDVRHFIERTAHIDPPSGLVQTVFRETEGNPFFIHEVVRLLESDGRLQQVESVTSWSLEVPEGIRQVVGRRLNRLSDDCNRSLSLASVIGRELEVSVLEVVAELEEPQLLDLLDEAVRAQMLEEIEGLPGGYRFSHALIRETLYEELGTTRRVRLHRRIGEALEEVHEGRIEPHLSELAYHFCECASEGNRDRAIDYAVRAAGRAAEQYGYDEATAHYMRAIQVLELEEPVDQLRLAELLLSLGLAHGNSGNPERGREVLRRAIDAARSIGAPELFARAVHGLGAHLILAGTTDPELSSLVEEALSLLPDRDSPMRARLLVSRAGELAYVSGMEDESESIREEALEMARRTGDAEAFALAHHIGFVLWTRPLRLKLAGIEEGIQPLEGEQSVDAAVNLGWLYFFRFHLHLEMADASAVDEDLAALDQLAEQTRHPVDAWFVTQSQAMLALMHGDFAEAEGLSSEALALRLKSSEGNARQYFGASLFVRSWLQGRMGEIEAFARQELGLYPEVPIYVSMLALMYSVLGQEAEAREQLERLAANEFLDLPQDYLLPTSFSYLAEVILFLGDRDRAALLYELILPYADRIFILGVNVCCLGSGSFPLGRLATLLERWPEAERHFEVALEMNKRIGARPFVALTQQAYADMLLERGESSDRERAFDLATQALDTAQELGMAQLVEKALASKLELQGVDSGVIDRSINVVTNSVSRNRPDLRTHAAPDGTVTLMFSDMEGFTKATERLGDLKARELIRIHNAVVREQLALHGGYEVELQGDGFLLAFGSAHQALLCAIAIQRAFELHNRDAAEKIRVRIGLHTGEALKDADKFFGRTVILASRIAAQARGGEILVSSILKELTESIGDLRFGEGQEVELKGISEPQRLHSVEWE
jgi:class 3 adenylate cyclase